ncbi:hypothetical protein H6F76_24180 [Leptolyngbya sp. FACHB-321]|uniref:hypothetical protein n=1 Tax=Leptolyngbya sp. FACHB-321 TaxID=2692807 RepID=UPI001687C39E|nr:hypothetical protein [Leptolyngbya sp. FACHB-321]MBD2038053.1 hypothetical protein [Leptolyngbya sp. FACHB-321]
MTMNPRDRALKHPKTGKSFKPVPPVVPQVVPPSKQKRLRRALPGMSSWSALVIIVLAAGGLASAGWLGGQLIVDPQTLLWVNRFLPDWIPIPVTGLKPPQTMEAIQKELTQAGRMLGEPIQLGKNISFLDHKTTVSDVLLPVLARRSNCQSNCEQIVQLRVYQTIPGTQREQTFQLLEQQAIVGPDETFVLTPLINTGDENQGSTRSLPLMTLNRFEGKVPTQGIWLNLSGRWLRGDSTIAYGQVLHYNPSRFHLHQMLEWSSPVGQEPVWQEMFGGGSPELVLDQTVGMEPQFQIYQVKPRNFLPSPLQLESLSLLEPAIDDHAYEQGLVLARSGLWSTGLQWLESVRSKRGRWSDAAQAQQKLIQLHAQATQTQANKSWASPGQQVLANLVDGRWRRALTVFTANAENSLETAAVLKADSGRLQNRVDATLRVSPAQAEARSWGALLIAAQQGSNAAIAWLKKQPKMTSQERSRITALIQRLEPSAAEDTAAITFSPGQIVGVAETLTKINAATWLKPKQAEALKLGEQQVWYRVQVAGFQDGKRWRLADAGLELPANTPVDRLWKLLGLAAEPPLSIVVWLPDGEQQVASASIKAVRVNDGKLELLAAGDPALAIAKAGNTTHQPLAFTDSALQWQTPETMPLADLVQQQPEWAVDIMPILVRELKRTGLLASATASTWDALEPLGFGTLPVQLATLTGGKLPDIILTVEPEALTDSTERKAPKQRVRPRTLIFSATGKLLYSESSSEADLTYLAIASLGSSGDSAIVASGTSNYSLLRWSAKRQRFE